MLSAFGFIPYLTVFQSRLGLLGLVLASAGEQAQQRVQLVRRLGRMLFSAQRISRSDSEWPLVLAYLNSKGQIGKKAKSSGPYKGLRLAASSDVMDVAGKPVYDLNVTQSDLWMADGANRSTIGAPTEPNLEEYCNLAVLLGLISGSTNSVRPLGRAALTLRHCGPLPSTPFALGLDAVVYLRSIIAADATVMRPFVSGIRSLQPVFTRDAAGELLPELYIKAVEALRANRAPAETIRECKKAIEPVVAAGVRRKQLQATGEKESLGVLEHRTAPRLEWLVDCGALNKPADERNAFVYSVTDDLHILNNSLLLDGNESPQLYAEECARRYFRNSDFFHSMRDSVAVRGASAAVAKAYSLLKRPVGPVAVRDLSLCASVMRSDDASVTDVESNIRELGRTDSRIRLSGDRYSRDAANVIIDESLIKQWLS